jgi:hypothetical protein
VYDKTAVDKVLSILLKSDFQAKQVIQSKGFTPSHMPLLKRVEKMLNFVPQLFRVIFNMAQNFLISIFTHKPQQQWKLFKISYDNKIFLRIQLDLIQESCRGKAFFPWVFQRLVQLVHGMKNVCY